MNVPGVQVVPLNMNPEMQSLQFTPAKSALHSQFPLVSLHAPFPLQVSPARQSD